MKTETQAGEHHVPLSLFLAAVTGQLALVLAIFAFISPSVFASEIHRPWAVLGWAILFGLPMSLFEYLYHRYLLHSAILPFVGAMHTAHRNHHNLTSVKAPVSPKEPGKMVEVSSEYPVEEPHQEESMMFPLWSLPAFVLVFLLLISLPMRLLFPGQPAFLPEILAVVLYYCSYEGWHAVLHLPYDRFWQPRIESPVTGKLATRMYSFHLMHHWRPTANLAIVGFWGIAVWDHVFRTHRRPDNLPLHGAEVNYEDAKLNKPLWPISQLDRSQARLYKASRSVEKFLARLLGRAA